MKAAAANTPSTFPFSSLTTSSGPSAGRRFLGIDSPATRNVPVSLRPRAANWPGEGA